MAKNTGIEWAHHTWNPWKGCVPKSPGCKNCYAKRLFDRQKTWGEFRNVTRSRTTFNDPLAWAKKWTVRDDEAYKNVLPLPERERVFTCSISDFFIDQADEWRDEAWSIIEKCWMFDFLVLTKEMHSVEYILERLPENWGAGYANVWLGTSTENQEMFDKRVPVLAQIPAQVKFLSAEPLLECIDMIGESRYCCDGQDCGCGGLPVDPPFLNECGIDWVILGGESGNETGKFRYRECKVEWLESMIAQSRSCGVPVFMKQVGTHLAKQLGLSKKGGEASELPASLQVREFPKPRVLYDVL